MTVHGPVQKAHCVFLCLEIVIQFDSNPWVQIFWDRCYRKFVCMTAEKSLCLNKPKLANKHCHSRPDTLDPALMRPGRLDRKVEFGLPELEVIEL